MIKKLRLLFSKLHYKVIFFVLGIGSLLWFLIRVIPKPSRANYPCLKAAAPIASSFIVYLLGLTTFAFSIKKAKERFHQAKYIIGTGFLLLGLIAGILITIQTQKASYAINVTALEGPNEPMGEGKGIFPGRVVWVHDPDATNENLSNSSNDYWWMDKNNDQAVIDNMVSNGIQAIAGKDNDSESWETIFRNFNNTHGYGDVGYDESEKIAIKLNLNNGGGFENRNNPENVDISPHLAYSILKQLINEFGVPQENIGIGDPGRYIDVIYWDKCHAEFPDVKYWGLDGQEGRTVMTKTSSSLLFYSDGTDESKIPECYVEAKYLINVPVFKAHHRAGVSLAAKNHFGSLLRDGSAFHLHWSLPCGSNDWSFDNIDYGMYRIFVDIMGYEHLGGKTMLYIFDGIWGSNNYNSPPIKFRAAPFNNDYPSSLFISQDPVAIESVSFDFLYAQFDPDNYGYGEFGDMAFPHIPAADDFLHQAADPNNWPEGINYDPENDGSGLTSLGVHEHWNNSSERKYSRNLGTGEGIELFKVGETVSIKDNEVKLKNNFELYSNYPNPFRGSTKIRYRISELSDIEVKIYNTQGQLIKTLVSNSKQEGAYEVVWDGKRESGSLVPPGSYVYKLIINNNKNTELSGRMLLVN